MRTLLPPHTDEAGADTQEQAGANEDADSNVDACAHEIDAPRGPKGVYPCGVLQCWGRGAAHAGLIRTNAAAAEVLCREMSAGWGAAAVDAASWCSSCPAVRRMHTCSPLLATCGARSCRMISWMV